MQLVQYCTMIIEMSTIYNILIVLFAQETQWELNLIWKSEQLFISQQNGGIYFFDLITLINLTILKTLDIMK